MIPERSEIRAAARRRALADSRALAVLSPDLVGEHLGIEPPLLAILARTPRVAVRCATLLTRKAALAPLSSMDPALAEAVVGTGPALDRALARIGLAWALWDRIVVDRPERQRLQAIHDAASLTFALGWTGRPAVPGRSPDPEDRSAVLAAGRTLLRLWTEADPARAGGWPLAFRAETERPTIVYPQRVDEIVRAALADTADNEARDP